MVSARSVKIGPSVLLAGNSAPVVGSVFVITPEAGEARGNTDNAVAIPPSRLPANPNVEFRVFWGVKLAGTNPLVPVHPDAVHPLLLATVPANVPVCCTVA